MSGSPAPPEFIVDRGLGKTVPDQLRRHGWVVHTLSELYPDDAQSIDDETWLRDGLSRGYFPLHKDGRIVGRDIERAPLVEFDMPMFFLTNQQLRMDEMVQRIHAAQATIYRHCRKPRAAAFGIGAGGNLTLRWPR